MDSKQCSVDGCERPAKARDMCGMHLMRLYTHGNLERVGRRIIPLSERFWSKVDQSGGPNACWLWTANCNAGGYGVIGVLGEGGMKVRVANRVSWELNRGPIPDGLWVLHNCPTGDNPACVNPSHLWLGTALDNALDKVAKGRASSLAGMKHPMARLNDDTVRQIRLDAAGGVSFREIGERYGVTADHARDIVKRLSWRHVS